MGWVNKNSSVVKKHTENNKIKKYQEGNKIEKSAKEVGKKIDINTPKPGEAELEADPLKALKNKYGPNKVNLYLARINSKDPKINAAASEIFNNPKIDAEIKKAMPKKEKKKEVKKYKPGGKTKRQKADELIYESGETYSGKKLRKILGIPSKKSIKDYKKKHRK